MDITNLLYNGDMSEGSKYWKSSSTSGTPSVSDGILTATGSIQNNQLIPIGVHDTYKLSFDIKFTQTSSSNFLIALIPFDSNKSSGISVSSVNKKSLGSTTDTTLAKELKKGDTTVTLTSAANWPTSEAYRRIGICNNLSWGYNRNSYSQQYTTISGNVLTLSSAWSGGTFPAGTKVACFF